MMGSYVRQRLVEIEANPALQRRPATRLGLRSNTKYVARWLGIVGNGKRFLILVHLIDGEKTVGELAKLIGLSRTASSQHLGLLTGERIVESRADGARRYYSCKSEAARAVVALVDSLDRDERLPKASLSTAVDRAHQRKQFSSDRKARSSAK